VERGQFWGILGPNGAGKSTTLSMLAGLVKPTAGSIQFFPGEKATLRMARARVGFMLDNVRFYPRYSGLENLKIYSRLFPQAARKSDAVVKPDNLMEQVGLNPRDKKPVKAYSLGMKQRLGLAAALLNHPEILVLDEPSIGLDPAATRDLWKLLHDRCRDDNLTILLSSHLLSDLEKYCSHVLLIHKGKSVASGTLDSIRSSGAIQGRRVTFETVEERERAESKLKAIQGISVSLPDQSDGKSACDILISVDQKAEEDIAAAWAEVLQVLAAERLIPVRLEQQQSNLYDLFFEQTGSTSQLA
jgi:ABC-type multidrug transport system ATPase subunit